MQWSVGILVLGCDEFEVERWLVLSSCPKHWLKVCRLVKYRSERSGGMCLVLGMSQNSRLNMLMS